MSEQIKQGVCPTGVVKAICISDKRGIEKRAIEAVSYTHLTLPTNSLV